MLQPPHTTLHWGVMFPDTESSLVTGEECFGLDDKKASPLQTVLTWCFYLFYIGLGNRAAWISWPGGRDVSQHSLFVSFPHWFQTHEL